MKKTKIGIKCLVCGAELFSEYRHDFQQCKCDNQVFIDGGDDYIRCGAKYLDKIKEITRKLCLKK